MPDIKHLGYGSLAIQLSEDKQITLGPRETKQISTDEFDADGIQKGLREGMLAVLPGDAPAEKDAPDEKDASTEKKAKQKNNSH